MDLYPAIDIRDGRCVRLVQGDFGRETDYGGDPVAVARDFAAAGAPWIHVVDLDAARTGRPENRKVVAAIAAAVDIPVQTGGGVRSVEAAGALFDVGVARVVVGTAAVEQPMLVGILEEQFPGRVAVGLDTRDGLVAVRGWESQSEVALLDAVAQAEGKGAAAVVVTDIGRDGMLEGPNLAQLAEVLASTRLPVIASGGVATLADLGALAALEVGGRRLAGAIVGTAIHEGSFTVGEAVAACARPG
ncbi:MAG TPA: 1-(5-phosphoribosyl)-5-[(5-phosphoribosylamino)methylideneamino]imidazole-4-carboxamide isomerase [Acidimicrobiales bacterium]|nr:1-(5-phosphoribosyl)-5-[(5-phosphoribosylamino)methylideneamino]imidazole-4-carboxamide isomerase [Acidimicrobiales bacterium]